MPDDLLTYLLIYLFNNIVSVSNLPTTQNVSITGSTGNASVTLTNPYILVDPVNGAMNVVIINDLVTTTSVNNFPSSSNVVVTNFPATSNVYVTDFPAIQNVLITNPTVSVNNFPSSSNVVVTNFPATSNVYVTDFPAIQNVLITNPSVSVTNFPTTQNVFVFGTANVSAIYTPGTQLSPLGSLKTSHTQFQSWYSPTVDKDGDFRFAELFIGNIITATANSTVTSNVIYISSVVNISPGAVVQNGSTNVPYSPPTYVVSVGNSNITLNQNVTVTSGNVLSFNNNLRLSTALSNQSGASANLYVSGTSGISPGDQVLNSVPGTVNTFPLNTWVVSVANATVVTLNTNVSCAIGDTITFQNAQSYFNVNTGDIAISPGTRIDGSAQRQTRVVQRIVPGSSHEVYQTVNINGEDPYTIKKFGFYSLASGAYFQSGGGTDTLQIHVRRTQPDGTVYEDVIPRASFNYDKLDGTGPSGLNLTTSNTVAITSWASTVNNPNFVGGSLVTYNVTANQGNTFTLGSSVLVSNCSPSTYNGVFSVSSYGTSNVTIAYPTNPGTFSSVTNGTLFQSQYHKYYTWVIDLIGGRSGQIRFMIGGTNNRSLIHVYNVAGQLSTPLVGAALHNRWENYNTAVPPYRSSLLIAGDAFNTDAPPTFDPGFAVAVSNLTSGYLADSGYGPILGFGLRPSVPFFNGDLQLKSINVCDISNKELGGGPTSYNQGVYFWSVVYNPLITGPAPLTYNVGKASRFYLYNSSGNHKLS